jgi:outer membrane protein assembly factor BamE
MRFIALAISCLLATGCGALVYKIDVQQGNYITKDLVDKLKPGMSKPEVRQLLGTPLLNDVFHADRWDYYYSNVKARGPDDRKRFTVFFKDDKVASYGGDSQPPAPPPVGTRPPGLPPAPTGPPPAATAPTPAPTRSPQPASSPLPSERRR